MEGYKFLRYKENATGKTEFWVTNFSTWYFGKKIDSKDAITQSAFSKVDTSGG